MEFTLNYCQIQTHLAWLKQAIKHLAISQSDIISTMILFLILIVSAAAFDKAGLKSGLQSTEGQLKLFRQWTDKEHSVYSAKEKKFRYEDFLKYFVLMRNVFYLKYSNTPIYRGVIIMEYKICELIFLFGYYTLYK